MKTKANTTPRLTIHTITAEPLMATGSYTQDSTSKEDNNWEMTDTRNRTLQTRSVWDDDFDEEE